jgi:sugar/nucleoside kinase (ribokinase family)
VRRVIAHTDILFVNVEEAQGILKSKLRDATAWLIGLHQLGAKLVAVTDGPRGAYAYDGTNAYSIRAFPAKRVDATGAGDSFACAFTAAIMLGHGLEEALRWGSVNSASEIATVGVQNGLLKNMEILEKLKKAKSYQAKKL